MKPGLRIAVGLTAGFIAALAGVSCRQAERVSTLEKPNVILLVIDALRPEQLGCYGSARDTSPEIDRLAREGVLFNKAFSQAPMTRMSMPSIFTSLYPAVHKVVEGASVLDDGFTTLAEVLDADGYDTICMSASPHRKMHYNFYQGFEEVRGKKEGDGSLYEDGGRLVDQAIDVLSAKRSRPLFLYLHFMDVHTPRDLSGSYESLFSEEGPETGGRRSEMIVRYDRMIRYVDDQVGRLRDELEKRGQLEQSVILVTSDHGEELLDHGNVGHHHSLYDELIHVPLVMRLPGARHGGKTFDDLVRHIDVMPTLLDMLQIESDIPMQGSTLMPLVEGGVTLDLTVYSEGLRRESEDGSDGDLSYFTAVRTEEWKLICYQDFNLETYQLPPFTDGDRCELFDLKDDPGETANLAGRNPEEVRDLRLKLVDWRKECEETRLLFERQGIAIRLRDELDEEIKVRIKALGYLK